MEARRNVVMSEDEYEDRLSDLAAYNVAAAASRRRRAYLAGPDILRNDADLRRDALKALCERYMLEGLWPDENNPEGMRPSFVFALRTEQIRRADIVIANISPFRGPGLEGGTAWEIGFAVALRKPVYAYTDDPRPYGERVQGMADGMAMDSFGLIESLMVACSINGPYTSAEEAMREAHAQRST